MTSDDHKRQAAAEALALVKPGMRLGLGTGSTARQFVDLLGERVKAGLDVVCVPTSEATRAQAEALGIRLTTLDETPALDLAIDGADEIDGELRLIKGGGGALLREKIVAVAAACFIVIADHSKQVRTLGAFPLPVEVIPFGHITTRDAILARAEEVGCEGPVTLRLGAHGKPFLTDNGNLIYDCAFGEIDDPEHLDEALKMIPGVVENGLFIGLADKAFIAGPGGVLQLDAQWDEDGD
jgi:ribose 5-phosphate isomerase A